MITMNKNSKKKDDVSEAHLEEETKAYFCPKKKKWIFEGDEEGEEDELKAPPPKLD